MSHAKVGHVSQTVPFVFLDFSLFFNSEKEWEGRLPNTEALPAALCKADEELVEGNALLGRFDPPLGIEQVRVRIDRRIRMDEISRLADWKLCSC